MQRYELLEGKTNGDSDFLLTLNGKVISRWAELSEDSGKWDRLAKTTVYQDLQNWDNQAEVGNDLSDYQSMLDGGHYDEVVKLAVEIDGREPMYIADDLVSDAVNTHNLKGSMRSFENAKICVRRLLIDGTLPEWHGTMHIWEKQAVDHVRKILACN